MNDTDWQQLTDHLAGAVARVKARYAEVRLERTDTTNVRFSGQSLESAGRSFDAGGSVRVLLDRGGWGVASFNGFGRIEDQLAAARDGAAVLACDADATALELAPVSPAVDRVASQIEDDFREVPLGEKVERMRSCRDRLMAFDTRVVDCDTRYVDRYVDKLLVTSEGAAVRQSAGHCMVSLMATARSGDNIQRGFETFGDGRSGFGLARSAADQVDTIASRAVNLLAAPRVRAGRYPVVLDPKLAGVFIHEAFGHLSEADHICENAQARKMMVLGRRFAPEDFHVYDDATMDGLWGSHRYDDEGVPTAPTPLIAGGRLTGRLHSRHTAAVMGERPTGNAYAINYQYAPIVRMSNTYIAPGAMSFDELIRPIRLGVYACGAFGGQTMLENFSFSAAYGWMIRDGRIAEPVRDIVLTGNLFETLGAISGIGDDLTMFSGGCGKGEQSPLPVALGSPHLRIDNVLIGGEG